VGIGDHGSGGSQARPYSAPPFRGLLEGGGRDDHRNEIVQRLHPRPGAAARRIVGRTEDDVGCRRPGGTAEGQREKEIVLSLREPIRGRPPDPPREHALGQRRSACRQRDDSQVRLASEARKEIAEIGPDPAARRESTEMPGVDKNGRGHSRTVAVPPTSEGPATGSIRAMVNASSRKPLGEGNVR
jgi:hypothetical protein